MMRSIKFLLLPFILLCSLMPAFAQHYAVTQSEEEFDVAYIQYDEMTPITVSPELQRIVPITQAFTVDANGLKGQILYSLFTDTGTLDETRSDEAALWMCMCLLNATGYTLGEIQIEEFDPADAKNEFNADFGINVFCVAPPSIWAQGYLYMNIDFFGKAGQGLVMRTMLSNDARFFGATEQEDSFDWNAPFFALYNSFLFLEKDDAGNYILPDYLTTEQE